MVEGWLVGQLQPSLQHCSTAAAWINTALGNTAAATHTAAPHTAHSVMWWGYSLMKIHIIVWAVSQCQPNLNKCWKKSNVAKSAAACLQNVSAGYKGREVDHGSQHGQHGDWRLWTPLMVHKSSRPNISLNNQTLLLCSPDPLNWFSFATKDGSWFWAADVLCAYNPSSIKCTVWCRFAVLVTRVV